MATRQFDPVAEVTSSFQLLLKNPMLAAPQLVAAVIMLIIAIPLGLSSLMMAGGLGSMSGRDPGAAMAALGSIMGGLGLLLLIGGALGLIAGAATVAAADEAWQNRPVDIGGAVGRAIASIVNILIFAIVVGIPLVLLSWTFIVPIAVCVLMMYGVPAIVIGKRSGIEAIGDSYRMVTQNFGPSIIAVLALIVVAIVVGIVGLVLHFIPLVGGLISIVLNALVVAFGACLIVRFYSLLRGSGASIAPTSMPSPPAAS